jgi:hypothetical protein
MGIAWNPVGYREWYSNQSGSAYLKQSGVEFRIVSDRCHRLVARLLSAAGARAAGGVRS